MMTTSSIEHDLRKEFHNMLGLMKIISKENLVADEEVKEMLVECLSREEKVSELFNGLMKNLVEQSE